jgi:hypothetical protein
LALWRHAGGTAPSMMVGAFRPVVDEALFFTALCRHAVPLWPKMGKLEASYARFTASPMSSCTACRCGSWPSGCSLPIGHGVPERPRRTLSHGTISLRPTKRGADQCPARICLWRRVGPWIEPWFRWRADAARPCGDSYLSVKIMVVARPNHETAALRLCTFLLWECCGRVTAHPRGSCSLG